MKEVKPSKKPLAIYYAIVLAVLLLLNLVLLPWMSERQVEEVDYGTFMTMTEEKNIGRVDIESNQIIFTDKEEKQVYKTGLMNDPELTQRLYDAGAQFSSEIVEQGSPMLNFLIWFLLPILLFSFIGNQMNKKLMEKAGGGPGSMMFSGVANPTPRSMCSPPTASALPMWLARTKPRRTCRRSWITCTTPASIRRSALPCPRASCWWALRAPARPCWLRPWQANPTCRSSPFPARSSWRCSWAWAPQIGRAHV